ncbi:hypothetical protein DMA15_04010 [Streptomyces sp. WAC 01529]|uniref:hypothetical protein n=1 Tax=Streptomyces sp. WAC 01529 TaxID=2203205 RepID=UPI000F6C7B51|nr:hypothetical protein [Streptomyces sp. WAC 01529]AZM51854.1 hypothetical protein DMA15_04010 [Streptomyces sp. WAC 01529]
MSLQDGGAVIRLRYLPGTGFALAGAVAAGITWEYVPQPGTWPLAVIAAVAMVCDAVIIAARGGRG